ncbi:MAG: hypothetical protein DHS20C12_29880 [Pseudohongiella sp.]|nr:MAG: hypothetical protein DHS20C12_29880 [Pseudohongiella sp.]
MSKANDPTLFQFFNEIGIISQLSSKLFEENLPDGLNNSQFGVLNWFMRVDTEATPGRLAKAFQVTPAAMTNTLGKLQEKGLIKVEPDAQSGRRKRVTLTRAGAQARDRAIKQTAPLFAEFAELFPANKLKRQLKELQKIRSYLDEYRYRE